MGISEIISPVTRKGAKVGSDQPTQPRSAKQSFTCTSNSR